MSYVKKYMKALLAQYNFAIEGAHSKLFDAFIADPNTIEQVNTIQLIQKTIMDSWKIKARINDIINTQIIIPNATVGKAYSAPLDFVKLGFNDIVFTEFEGLSAYGLLYNNESETIEGTPTQSGDFKVSIKFRIEGEPENSDLHTKKVSLVINANPKSLWKDIPSTETPTNFWKPDNTTDFKALGDKHLVVASKRGRSHANVGSFRDDHFASEYFEKTGWSIVCVADGAGSAKLSRQGSKLACEGIISYFAEHFTEEAAAKFNDLVLAQQQGSDSDTQKKLSLFLYDTLGKAALSVHKKIEAFANKAEASLKDFHTTLIFTLFKKYPFGYAILTFGVGDCPIGLLNKDLSAVKLMNWLDVGEFGGGTRFITMPEIFSSDKFATRFGFTIIEDFSYLVLMTDGIYDAKFVVEANLEKLEKWTEFMNDLGGNNADDIRVDFNPNNKEITNQLSTWMDFWSAGNHDDRTLAIIF